MKIIYKNKSRVDFKNEKDKHHRVGLGAIEFFYKKKIYHYRFNGKEHRINGVYYTSINYHMLYDLGIKINVGKLVL